MEILFVKENPNLFSDLLSEIVYLHRPSSFYDKLVGYQDLLSAMLLVCEIACDILFWFSFLIGFVSKIFKKLCPIDFVR